MALQLLGFKCKDFFQLFTSLDLFIILSSISVMTITMMTSMPKTLVNILLIMSNLTYELKNKAEPWEVVVNNVQLDMLYRV